MTQRFLPDNYKRDLYLKVSNLSQGRSNIEEYVREFEQLQIRSGLEEEPEQTMARFLKGLDRRIAEKVDLQPYWSLEDLCKLAIKVQKYSEGKRTFGGSLGKPTTPYKPFTPQKSEVAHKESVSKAKGKPFVKEVPRQLDGRKCFKCQGYGHFQADCPNRRVLTLKEIEEIDCLASELVEEEETEEEIATVLIPDMGELLVLQRILHTTEGKSEENRRDHIFRSRCTIQGKVCSLMIDGGSCTNVASTNLVSKLGLTTIPHPRPYSLQWLKKGNEVQVTKQALISFSVGNLRDEVLCDFLPMDACHLLFGRPW